MTKKRKLNEISKISSGSDQSSSPVTDIDGTFNPIKRLKKDLDHLKIHSPLS